MIVTPEMRQLLATLSPEQRGAVQRAVVEWISVAQASEYEPISGWENALAEVGHSALLARILSGKEPLPKPPPRAYSYPGYGLVEDGEATAYEVWHVRAGESVLLDDSGWLGVEQARWKPEEVEEDADGVVRAVAVWPPTGLRCRFERYTPERFRELERFAWKVTVLS